jgi:hypothetical protein
MNQRFEMTTDYCHLLNNRLAVFCAASAMVSPTGIDGFCKGQDGPWGIPFKGFVNAT